MDHVIPFDEYTTIDVEPRALDPPASHIVPDHAIQFAIGKNDVELVIPDHVDPFAE